MNKERRSQGLRMIWLRGQGMRWVEVDGHGVPDEQPFTSGMEKKGSNETSLRTETMTFQGTVECFLDRD